MAKDIAFYLSKGFDRPMAEYFASGRKRITFVAPNDDFTLTLEFDNGETRILDCKPFLQEGTVFAPFLRIEDFRRVYLDSDHNVAWDVDPTIDSETVWDNKVDLSPDRCYVDSVPIGGVKNAR